MFWHQGIVNELSVHPIGHDLTIAWQLNDIQAKTAQCVMYMLCLGSLPVTRTLVKHVKLPIDR